MGLDFYIAPLPVGACATEACIYSALAQASYFLSCQRASNPKAYAIAKACFLALQFCMQRSTDISQSGLKCVDSTWCYAVASSRTEPRVDARLRTCITGLKYIYYCSTRVVHEASARRSMGQCWPFLGSAAGQQ